MDQTPKSRPSVKKKAAQKEASRAAREEARRIREEERAAREEERRVREEERVAQEMERAAQDEERIAREQAELGERLAWKKEQAKLEEGRFAHIRAFRGALNQPSDEADAEARGFGVVKNFDAGKTAVIAPLRSNEVRGQRRGQEETARSGVDDAGFSEPEKGVNPPFQAARVSPTRYRGGDPLDCYPQGNGAAVGMNAAQSYKRKRNPLGIAFRFLAALIAITALAAVAFLGILTITEFRPRDTTSVEVSNPVQTMVQSGQSLSILTWNIGYAGSSASATSYLDGGAGVRAESAEIVKANMSAMENVVADQSPDFAFLQEVDRASDRSFKVNEEKAVSMSMEAIGRSSAFAQDFKAPYVPHPWPFLGAVDSGSMTMNKYKVESAERISLPSAQSWPMSLISPDACVLVEKLPIEGSDKKLVLMNVRFDDHASEEVNDAQAKELALLMKREADKGNYVIAGGDFDQNFSSTDVRAFGKEISRIRSTGVLDEGLFADGMQFEMDSSTPTMRSLCIGRLHRVVERDGRSCYDHR